MARTLFSRSAGVILSVFSIHSALFRNVVCASSSPGTNVLDRPPAPTNRPKMASNDDLLVVFSDLDGTLIHYPQDPTKIPLDEDGNRILQLPPSATGMKGLISSRTLSRCRDIRRKGVKLVLVSGMRTSTLVKRLPYLPKADAYCTEAGGRIFYPTKNQDECGFLCNPVEYDGAEEDDLTPFGLREDMNWRKRMERKEAAGWEGYEGNEITRKQDDPIPMKQRSGSLWKFASKLEEAGITIDSKSYSTCFRVNRKQQTGDAFEKFDELLRGDISPPSELSTSTNLGCIDYYPSDSGKKNCCQYLADHFGGSDKDVLAHSVCLCDDDNDIEMALSCAHAYIPALSSQTMKATIERNEKRFTTTFSPGIQETQATEDALQLIYNRIVQQKP